MTELIPARQQTLWRWPAVANFVLGGAGGGVYAVAALTAGFGASPALALAAWLGPALVLAGFGAVALEAGRPLRGARVLRRPGTSWMSRELWIGGAFVALALAGGVRPSVPLHALAAAAAVALVVAQGFILREARAVAAWDVAVMPVLFLASGLVSGAGLLALVEVAGGRAGDDVLAEVLLVLLAFGGAAWPTYARWSTDPAFLDATRGFRTGLTALVVLVAGHVVPFVLVALAATVPGVAAPATALAGILMLAAQAQAKGALILVTGRLRPITVPGLTLQRRSS